MPELIALHQIVTREKKGGARIVIPPNSRFDPSDYPMISEREWRAMLSGEHPIIRVPDDPAYVSPSTSAAPTSMPAVTETDESIVEDEEARRERLAGQPKTSRKRRRRAAVEDDDDI